MKLFELDDRLIATNDTVDESAVWKPKEKAWRKATPYLAAKAYADGRQVTVDEATAEHIDIDLASVLDLS